MGVGEEQQPAIIKIYNQLKNAPSMLYQHGGDIFPIIIFHVFYKFVVSDKIVFVCLKT